MIKWLPVDLLNPSGMTLESCDGTFEGAVIIRALSLFDLCVCKTTGVCQGGLP